MHYRTAPEPPPLFFFFFADTALTELEDCLKKFISRPDIDIILINQNVSTARNCATQRSDFDLVCV